jgi:prepilin-type N-terminal cleavage/methylation domain-containing protein
MTALIRAVRERLGRDDDGLTLIEMVVAIVVLTVVMSMFTGAMLQIYRNVNKTEAVSGVQSQLNVAFLRLDKEIRYASAISDQVTSGGDYFFRFLISNTGTSRCVELKLDGTAKKLLRRDWTQTSGTPAVSPWLPLASSVTSTSPFLTSDAADSYAAPSVRIRLRATTGATNDASSRATDMTFTAQNAYGKTADATVCSEGISVP